MKSRIRVNMKLKSIKSKIMFSVITLVGTALLVLGIISCYLNYSSTNALLENDMKVMADIAAERVSQELQAYKNIISECGSVSTLASSITPLSNKKDLIERRVNDYGFERGNLIGKDGQGILFEGDFNNRDYFQRAMNGEIVVSEPIISQVTGEASIIIAGPLWRAGIPNSSVEGVVYFVPKQGFLDDIVNSISISENGKAYIINGTGSTMAHYNHDYVINANNTTENAKTNPSLSVIADLEAKMMRGENGFGTYTFGGVKKFLAYAPIEATDGWSIGLNAPVSDFMDETVIAIFISAAVLIVAVIISVIVAMMLASRIANPIRECVTRIDLLSKGDLESDVPHIDTDDETGVLSNATGNLINSLKEIISDIDYILGRMSEGDFAVVSKNIEMYVGNFRGLIESMRKIKYNLGETLSAINVSADQVSSGSEQVSSAAQALSQGTTEQASSIEELAATINEVSSQIKNTAENANDANSKAKLVEEEAAESNERMREMVSAMDDISNSSSEIGKIIKTIEDIAFQTNILALNAAVEAARAGAAGKGFAVVADEVRNLASKSAEASKNSSSLVENSLRAVEHGTKIADDTAKSMLNVVNGIREVADAIDKISDATVLQKTEISQVSVGTDQISSVTQTNSATAEESAAASEELSAQAQMMKELVAKFTIEKR